MAGSYFLTTAIDYVNSAPHLGHAYEKVLADFFARHELSLERDVLFLTGVDEHGQKVQQSAQREGVDPQAFSDRMSARFQALHASLGVESSKFVRTTDPHHKQVVRDWLQKLHDRGEIFFQEHEGYYSVRQEQFVTEKDKVDGQWPEIFGEVIHTKEPNYYFRLEPYRRRLLKHLEDHPDFIVPTFRRKELLGALAEPLADLCISRPKSRLAWGIPLPFNEDYVTYVWFDALVNYYSFAAPEGKQWWPPDLQIIGKDILIPAHGVYWPIMLFALGVELPKHLLVHGFWTNSGAKISKSDAKSLVDPVPYVDKYGPDALRYFVLREMVLGQDADFSDERFEVRYTSELAKGLGNLTNRTLSMLARYREGKVPNYDGFHLTETENDLRSDAVVDEYKQAVADFAPHLALQAIWKFAQRADKYVEETAPFRLAKDPAQAKRLDVVLGHLAESVRRLSVLVQAALPFTAIKMRSQLNLPLRPVRLEEARFGNSLRGHTVGQALPLFPALEEKGKAESLIAMNVTDVSPVRIDQPEYVVVLDWTFELITLICFLRVATYVTKQARQHTLVASVRSPMPFPVSSTVGALYAASVILMLFARSPLYMLLVLAGLWVFLTVAQRSAEHQFGLGRLSVFDLVRWSLVICGAVSFLESPLTNLVDGTMTWLQVPHPVQESVETFRQSKRPGDITLFLFQAVIISPLIEELFFRGFLYSYLKRFGRTWLAVVLSGGVFAFVHVNLGSALPLWLLGIVLAVAYEHTGSLLLSMGIHACFNLLTAISLLMEKGSS